MKTVPHTVFIGKKHWVVYIIPTLLFLTGVFMLASGSSFWQFLGGALVIINGSRILASASVKWTLTPTTLYIKIGSTAVVEEDI